MQDEDGHYVPINSIKSANDQKRSFIAANSHLSEYAVLGFEYGYAITHPMCLVLWEAQFGDFANGAQIMIDQFIASGETKWNVKNGLVMLLPHGYDGQGPEHSSCRIERYLQLTDASDTPTPETAIRDIQERINMRVVNPTTAANYFHFLRSQVRRPFRKPAIVVAPKKLLKLRGACSDIEEFSQGLRFRKVIDDVALSPVADDKIRRVIFCSG
jgi:2-oxoglutarate dehydrogenase E1 component